MTLDPSGAAPRYRALGRHRGLEPLTPRGRRPDAWGVAVYDKLDWHYDGAVSAGQPPENAFTHIGFYLAWLIRHDLHNLRFLSRERAEAVKRGEMTGSDLADDIDTKLVGQVMKAEGRAFSEARYGAYLTGYEEVFKHLPEYGVVDVEANYLQAEALLDRLYAEWVDEGRPKPPPEPPLEGDLPTLTSVSVMMPAELPEGQWDELLSAWGDTEIAFVPPPTEEHMPHVAPDLEALIPRDLTTPPMELWSVRGTEWGSSLLNRALKRLETRPKDAVVVNAIGGEGKQGLFVIIYGVAGASAERLEAEFRSAIARPPGSKWQKRHIAGRDVNWASGRDGSVAYWARDGLVLHVAGEAGVEGAIERLP